MEQPAPAPTTAPQPSRVGVILSSVGVFWFAVLAQRLTVSLFFGASSLLADFGITAAAAGLLAAVYFPVYGLVQVPAGLLADRADLRRILGGAAVVLLLASLAFAVAPSVEWAVVARASVGFSSGLIWVPALRLAADLDRPRYSRNVGLLVALGSIGTIATQLVLPLLLVPLHWRAAAALWALPVALMIPVLLTLPLPIRPKGVEGDTLRPALGAAFGTVGRIVRDPRFWALALPGMMWNGAYFGALTWLPRYGRDVLGVPAVATGVLPSFVSIGLIASAPLAGFLLSRAPATGSRVYFGGALGASLLLALLPAAGALGLAWLLYPVALGLGLLFGLYFVNLTLLARTVKSHELGTASGALNGLSFVPAFFNPWFMGLLLDLIDRPQSADPTYSTLAYSAALLFIAGGLAVGTLAGAALHLRTGRRGEDTSG